MANEGQTAVVNEVRRSQPIEHHKNVLRLWSGISSLANRGGSERRELGDGRLAERGQYQHTSNALVGRGSGNTSMRNDEEQRVAVRKSERMLQQRLDRGANNTSGVQRAWVASRVRVLIGLMRRSRFQRTTTPGLISCDAGEHCLVLLRAGNKRQQSKDIPRRWNRCRHHLREGCCWKTCFVATRGASSSAKCVETVMDNVGHGTRLNMGTCGCWLVWN